MFASDTLQHLANAADFGYFVIGIVVFWAVSRIYKGTTAKETNSSALATIEILKSNIEAVDKQRAVERDAADKVIVRLEKQVDDMTERLRKADDQIKTLSVIPWERQQQNHNEVMGCLATISENQERLVVFLESQQPQTTTTIQPGGKVKVERKGP